MLYGERIWCHLTNVHWVLGRLVSVILSHPPPLHRPSSNLEFLSLVSLVMKINCHVTFYQTPTFVWRGYCILFSEHVLRWEECESLLWGSVGVREKDMISTKLEERMRLWMKRMKNEKNKICMSSFREGKSLPAYMIQANSGYSLAMETCDCK